MDSIKIKQKKLHDYFTNLGSVAIAYSGGVDSTYLLAAAHKALGDKVVGVIGKSPTYPKRELNEAIAFAKKIGAKYQIVETNELEVAGFRDNPPERCFWCKSTLFKTVWQVAKDSGISNVVEGSNADDVGDFRPGMTAAKKLGVLSPLKELGFTKDEIRFCSNEMALPTWNKPAFACLSSRIPYGQIINIKKLSRIEKAEDALKDMGIEQYRVRDHGDIARIEVRPEDVAALASGERREQVVCAVKAAGYQFVCLDLEGYRSGSMNETLSQNEKDISKILEK